MKIYMTEERLQHPRALAMQTPDDQETKEIVETFAHLYRTVQSD